ncbi:FKBP-type peptidyl-prolyl cis-trans isomerase [Geoalkalibacter halelectricus]|uniref:Peptidyl-prolyl cis-trans isomerase n=1 Tax=Geoalkalibacter halelectricus TaxID=2847045 RepID=A0ABY5ZK12_9BACT|nr:peptidylprolyl isomerase [Geoalkalibacter halelectricus]MDO3379487.1 peptidylprolyl isomerase [Geoalkalibacter halelectricus]UWZ78079.1 peptidylprolyl isomerase [Geoalkalibacter halelectricus]
MSQAKSGDRVRLHFVGRLDDGTIFESSEECIDDDCGCTPEDECGHAADDCGCEPEPLEFTIGAGEVFPALEQAIIGMSPGESRNVRLEAADAYGERNDEMVFEVPRSDLPPGMDPEEGEMLELAGDEGEDEDEGFPVWVAAVNADSITLDGNHPLAGNALNFDFKLLEILPGQ